LATAGRLLGWIPQRAVATLNTYLFGADDLFGANNSLRRNSSKAFPNHPVFQAASVPSDTPGLNVRIAIQRNTDQVTYAVTADSGTQIEADELIDCITSGLDWFLAVANATKRSRRVGNLMLLSS
jgi:hypothetical protein